METKNIDSLAEAGKEKKNLYFETAKGIIIGIGATITIASVIQLLSGGKIRPFIQNLSEIAPEVLLGGAFVGFANLFNSTRYNDKIDRQLEMKKFTERLKQEVVNKNFAQAL